MRQCELSPPRPRNFTMLETPSYPSAIHETTVLPIWQRQVRFLGSDPASPGGLCFRKSNQMYRMLMIKQKGWKE